MPCTDDGVPYTQPKASKKRNTADKQKIDLLTAMLCSLCQWVDDNCGNQITMLGYCTHERLPKWWLEHKQFDEQRKKDIRAKVLARLTDEEKEVLGIPTKGVPNGHH